MGGLAYQYEVHHAKEVETGIEQIKTMVSYESACHVAA